MKRKRGGSIIDLTSIVGVHGNAGETVVTSSSKAALIGLTKSAAKELASAGVRVNAVAPGFIDTDMTLSHSQRQICRAGSASVTMGRIGSPEDIARAIDLLASDEAANTGQVFGVDGGMLI